MRFQDFLISAIIDEVHLGLALALIVQLFCYAHRTARYTAVVAV